MGGAGAGTAAMPHAQGLAPMGFGAGSAGCLLAGRAGPSRGPPLPRSQVPWAAEPQSGEKDCRAAGQPSKRGLRAGPAALAAASAAAGLRWGRPSRKAARRGRARVVAQVVACAECPVARATFGPSPAPDQAAAGSPSTPSDAQCNERGQAEHVLRRIDGEFSEEEKLALVDCEQKAALESSDIATLNKDLLGCIKKADAETALHLIEDAWKRKQHPNRRSYCLAVHACVEAKDKALTDQLRAELREFGPADQADRFHLTPNVAWEREFRRAGCGARNTMDWKGNGDLPVPERPADRCWLVPSQDLAALRIAENQDELRAMGWRVLSCEPSVIDRLRNKSELHDLFHSIGLGACVPRRWVTLASAEYPCIIKPALGTYGKDTEIVYTSEEALRITHREAIYGVERRIQQEADYNVQYYKNMGHETEKESWEETQRKTDAAIYDFCIRQEHEDLGPDWLCQEMLEGQYEYSTTLLVRDGRIWDVCGIRYEYDSDFYVWPRVKLVNTEHVSVPTRHLQIFLSVLHGFSGVCNFNYKIRPSRKLGRPGEICIFEVNPRVGGDLAFDVPKPRVTALLEKMDAVCP